MKILMTLMVTLMTTSVFAECSLNGKCDGKDADKACKALDASYYLTTAGYCVQPEKDQKDDSFDVCNTKDSKRDPSVKIPASAPAAKTDPAPAPAVLSK